MKKIFIFLLFVSHIYSFSLTSIVSIAPEKFFVEKIAGNILDVETLITPGIDAHSYSPTPRQLIKISKADVYFAIGLEFERSLIEKIKNINKDLLVVDISKVCQKRKMEDPFDMHEHESSSYIKHHERFDPHVWTSPSNVIKMSGLIADELSKEYPEKKDYFAHNLELFKEELNKTIKDINGILSFRKDNRIFMIFHPSWGYFADEFDLTQIPVQIEGKQPTIKELKHILDLAKKKDIKTLFVQPQYGSNAPKIIADYIGADLQEIYALEYDYINNLLSFAEKIRDSFKKENINNE